MNMISRTYMDGLKRALEIAEETERGKTAGTAIRKEIRKCQMMNEQAGIRGVFTTLKYWWDAI